MLEVLAPGLLTTVQDAGRPWLGHLGVPLGGACDPWARSVANLLVGNEPDAAVLELTLVGPTLRVVESTVIGLAGADLGAVVEPGGRRLLPGRSHGLGAGSVVSFPGAPAGEAGGIRAYLAVPGGIDLPLVLGSRSTCLAAGFGGLEGRPLAADDVVRARRPGSGVPGLAWPVGGPAGDRSTIRVLPGPHAAARPEAFDRLVTGAWRVAPASDRMGLRLDGPPVAGGGETLSQGMTWGAIQVPPDGRPIVLLVDAQPTGGYPVVAIAISADRPHLAQAGPGQPLRFVATTEGEARRAILEQHARLEAGARALADDVRREEPAHPAGASAGGETPDTHA